MKHTKLPWHNIDNEIYTQPTTASPTEGYYLAMVNELVGDGTANAEFIVKACNTHEELVARLKLLVSRGHASLCTQDEYGCNCAMEPYANFLAKLED